MDIYHSIEEFASTGYDTQVALGFFDGVHLGHRAVLRDCAANKGVRKAVALTFSESPSKLLGAEGVRQIVDNDRKAQLMGSLGIDAVIFEDFSRLKEMPAEEFITEVLQKQLRAKKICCGYNYCFGSGGTGNTALLREICHDLGIAVSVAEPVYCGSKPVSSSMIRYLLQNGNITTANQMLGLPFSVTGVISSGNHLGSTMGYPTVNIPIGSEIITPCRGVYASRIVIDETVYRGATNIGVHPTVGAIENPLCETFLLDYNGEDLYGRTARCELLSFLRPEQLFPTPDALILQIAKDISAIKDQFGL